MKDLKEQLSLEQIISEKIMSLDELIKTQSSACECGEYQIGIYNGLVLARSVLTGEEPVYYNCNSKEMELLKEMLKEYLKEKEDNKNGIQS